MVVYKKIFTFRRQPTPSPPAQTLPFGQTLPCGQIRTGRQIPWADTPPEQTPPGRQTPPFLAGRHAPGRQTPPTLWQADTPPGQTPSPWQADTPQGRPLHRTLRILLECLLVLRFNQNVLSKARIKKSYRQPSLSQLEVCALPTSWQKLNLSKKSKAAVCILSNQTMSWLCIWSCYEVVCSAALWTDSRGFPNWFL